MNPNRPHFAPWDEREWPRLLSADEGARRVRIFARVERRQAELLEQWAGKVTEPHLQTTLKRHARHCEWHAQLWSNALADSDAGDADDADLNTLLDAIGSPSADGELVEFLTGIYRVLVPRKVTAYTYYQRAIGTPDSDADWRWIDFIMKDELDAIRDGELSLQSLLTGTEDVERSANRKAELEKQLVKTGGIAGPDTIGMASNVVASARN